MSNTDPIIHCTLDGHRTEMTRRNSGLFTFMGKLATYDHAWVYNEEIDVAGYIWRDVPEHHYLQYAKFMIENYFPIHKNLWDVQECDMRAYQNTHQPQNIIQFPKAFEGIIKP